MFESSRDLLYVVLTFAILWLTIFVSLVLFYVVVMFRQAIWIIKNFRTRAEQLGKAAERIKEKLENPSTYLGLVATAVEKIISFVAEKKQKAKNKK